MIQSIKSYEAVVAFHGHACPGLALGYRATEYALQHYRACVRGGKFVCMPCAGEYGKG
jgi:formylmethanofuran dehydrogenase subunit E